MFDAFATGDFLADLILSFVVIRSCCGMTYAQSTPRPQESETDPQSASIDPNITPTTYNAACVEDRGEIHETTTN